MADVVFDFEPVALQQVDIWNESGRDALSRALGFPAPGQMGAIAEQNGIRAARLSLRRFWIIGNPPLLTLAPEDGAVLPLDQGRVSFKLPGERARRVLPQVMAIDWDDPRAAPSRIVLSAIHRVPAAVLPLADGQCELIVPRSFAESIGGLIAELQAA